MNKRTGLALMLALVLVLTSACGKNTDTQVTPVAEPAATAEPTAEPTEEPAAETAAVEETAEQADDAAAEETAEQADDAAVEEIAMQSDDAEVEAAVAEAAAEAEVDAESAATATPDEAEVDVAVAEAADEDPVLATASNGEVTLKLSEIKDEFDQTLESYISYYAQYGYTLDEYDTDFQESVAQETVQVEMSRRVVKRYAAQNGYELTEEKDADLRSQVQAALDSIREYYESYLTYYGYSGEELEQIIDEELEASGYTEDSLYESALLRDVLDFIYELSTADVTITDEEVQAAFDEKVAEQATDYADVDTFISDYLSEEDILYVPENVRKMLCIYIEPDDETETEDEADVDAESAATATPTEADVDAESAATATPAEVDVDAESAATATPAEADVDAESVATAMPAEADVDAESAATAMPDEAEVDAESAATATPAEAEVDAESAATAMPDEAEVDAESAATAMPDEAEVDISTLTGRAKAQAVLAAIQGGMDFTEAMYAYNEDGSTQAQLDLGYPMSADCTTYSDEFANGAMALEHVGDMSDVIETSYGYFILYYAEDMTAGAVSLADRMEQETEEALLSKKNDVYSESVDVILDLANIEIGDLSPLYHVYADETVEATVAYAQISEETALLDMPSGDPVATLSAGASLDVLGRITIDGETYAFVAVPGTTFKGYLNETAMTDMDADAALAVDNTALATACEALDKLPTFTIVMNDGSLIYGELYPDVAPESVGNFVELANSGFYNGLTFHRVVPGFVIQGGDPNGDGTGGPGYAIRGEFSSNGVTNDLSHTRGVLSMARSSSADSAGSQFFIMHADNDYLDGDYAAFGMVIGGIETVDLIASVPTNSNNKPLSDQVMREVCVETYGKTYTFTKLED